MKNKRIEMIFILCLDGVKRNQYFCKSQDLANQKVEVICFKKISEEIEIVYIGNLVDFGGSKFKS